jgi:RNA polymerase sigma-70 factor (ECF subfamily)
VTETSGTDLEAELTRLHPASFSWALNCCGRNREAADDVLQASYLKILEGKARFDGRSAFKTFLFAVIRLTAREHRRREVWRALRLAHWEAVEPVPLPPPDQQQAAEASERRARFLTALSKLARRQREVLDLVFGHDLTLTEAAATLQISIGSARRHYDRGKKRLARELSGSRS